MSQLITCKDCGEEFTLSDEEIEFFQSKIDPVSGQPLALPKRCKRCRQLKKQRNLALESREGQGGFAK